MSGSTRRSEMGPLSGSAAPAPTPLRRSVNSVCSGDSSGVVCERWGAVAGRFRSAVRRAPMFTAGVRSRLFTSGSHDGDSLAV
jgi:hypothetical protein